MLNPSNHRILVVDDVSSIHQDFRKILTPENEQSFNQIHEMKSLLNPSVGFEKNNLPPFELQFASQSTEAIELVRKSLACNQPFAVAFVDVQMPPGEDGVETIARIWEIDREIQTVICTAFAKYTWEDIHLKFGDSDRLFVLKKPFDNIEIIQLACALSKKWNMQHLRSTYEPTTTTPQTSNTTMKRLDDAMNILSKLNSKLKQPDENQ